MAELTYREAVARAITQEIVRDPDVALLGEDFVGLALMARRVLEAADILSREHGIEVEVVDLRSLVPLDTRTLLVSVSRTHRLFTVEENHRPCGRGARIASNVADEKFYELDGSVVRITLPPTSPCPPPSISKTMLSRM